MGILLVSIALHISLFCIFVNSQDSETFVCELIDSVNVCGDAVTCTASDSCDVHCYEALSCVDMTIDCGSVSTCTIFCDGFESCTRSTVISIDAQYLDLQLWAPVPDEIDNYTGSQVPTSANMSIYCPVTDSIDDNCQITCIDKKDKIGGYFGSCIEMNIYAVEGSSVSFVCLSLDSHFLSLSLSLSPNNNQIQY